jgi:hypothetical protein
MGPGVRLSVCSLRPQYQLSRYLKIGCYSLSKNYSSRQSVPLRATDQSVLWYQYFEPTIINCCIAGLYAQSGNQ